MEKEEISSIIRILSNDYKDAKCALNFGSAYQLLVATILSAQCTDERVNLVTKDLFNEYGTPYKMIELSEEQLGEKIKSCGFYKNKSKNILASTKEIIQKYNGEVPNNMEDLILLKGVGRKTANVVLSNAFGIPAIAVDTHVLRVSNRIGLAHGNDPNNIEQQLMKIIPRDMWSEMHHYLIWHGRKICKARKPQCEQCPVARFCEYYSNVKEK